MNLSQFCNITLFSRPAARYTNKDRLLYSTTSSSGGRFASTMPAGFTLVEVLVAMVILLVGIWTLAVSFPKLLGVVATQEKRTEMARQADRTLNQLTRHPNDLPLGIAGADSSDATGQPWDPSISDFAITPLNARDDMIEIIGERFTVPAPLAFPYGSYPIHVFRQGLALATDPPITQVFREQGLPTGFSVDPDGTVNFPLGVDLVEINYDWVESGAGGATHHVYREVIVNTPGTKVAAAGWIGTFGQALPGTVEGIWLFSLTVILGPGSPLGINDVIEHPSGASLLFDEGAAGARMRVNYVLLTEPDRHDRRALIMSEEHRIVSSLQTVTLVASHIEDEMALPVDLNADTLYNDTNILAVDLNTGYVYWEGSGLDWLGEDAATKGQITVGYSSPAPEIGHDLRFYYVTLDQDLISVQIAPATFVDADIASPADLYRSYLAAPDLYDPAYTALLFYPCNAGHTVSVDYKYDDGSTIITVNAEMHTISTEPGNHHITLNWPGVTPIEIIAVTGKSLQAIAWWRTPNGRLERLELSTVR